MKKVEINNALYYTNITDKEQYDQCVYFVSKGCQNYAISFDNIPKHVIQSTSVKGIKVKYLRGFNFDKCFLPSRVALLESANEILQKGCDLIEII